MFKCVKLKYYNNLTIVYIMPAIDFSKMGFAAREIEREWKKTLREHNAYKVKNMYHKKKDMAGWDKKQQEINNHYRTQLKDLEKEAKKKHMELEQMRKEEERLLKIAEEKKKEAETKKKEAAKIQRKINKEKKLLERSKQTIRKSKRLATKTKRRRCPNGTRRNKKTDNCDKK